MTKKKIRKDNDAFYQLARKIYAYRKDLMAPAEIETVAEGIAAMEKWLKQREADPAEFAQWKKRLEPLLEKHGQHFYPRHFWAENTEMLLFAAILAIGLRSFFFQPFKIPTNSMYPSYNGMTAAVFVEEAPNAVERMFRFVAFGASHQSLTAPSSGELGFVEEAPRLIPARKWFVLPSQKLRYTFLVGNDPLYLDVPMQFDIRLVLNPLFADRQLRRRTTSDGRRVIMTGIQVERGQRAFAMDVLTGDQLFVDRMSYHFRRPRVGDPIVFRTDNIEMMSPDERGKYYIKRAAAGPNDILVIDPPGLLLNGEPITGARAFEANRLQIDGFSGYVHVSPSAQFPMPVARGREPIEVPPGHYFALGDNSPNSADSRMWGFVPETEIVGRAIFIYYPFTSRWGVAR